MKFSNTISVFIPTYNSSNFIEYNILDTYNFLSKNFYDFELIAVDDNSSDNTVAILQKLQGKLTKLRVVPNKQGPSKRENLGKAMLQAKFPTILFQDQDLAVPLDFILSAFSLLNAGEVSVVIGQRNLTNSSNRTFSRKVISKIINKTFCKVFKIKTNDIFCGFKMFDTKTLHKILLEMGYDHQFKRGWFWDVELLWLIEKNKIKFKELPVSWTNHHPSNISILKEFVLFVYFVEFFKKTILKRESYV